MEPSTANPCVEIALTDAERIELRVLESQKLLADANAQAANAILHNRAQQIAQAHGIDLSESAKGGWLLTIEDGIIHRKPEESQKAG